MWRTVSFEKACARVACVQRLPSMACTVVPSGGHLQRRTTDFLSSVVFQQPVGTTIGMGGGAHLAPCSRCDFLARAIGQRPQSLDTYRWGPAEHHLHAIQGLRRSCMCPHLQNKAHLHFPRRQPGAAFLTIHHVTPFSRISHKCFWHTITHPPIKAVSVGA